MVRIGLVWLSSRKAPETSNDVFTQRPPPLHTTLCRPHAQAGGQTPQTCVFGYFLSAVTVNGPFFVPQETAAECIISTDPPLTQMYFCTIFMLKQTLHFILQNVKLIILWLITYYPKLKGISLTKNDNKNVK